MRQFSRGRTRQNVKAGARAPAGRQGPAVQNRLLARSLGLYSDLDTLWFNGDAYLTAAATQFGRSPEGGYVVNLSRAVMKHLITRKWGIMLHWGGSDALIGKNGFAEDAEIPAVGDFNGDGMEDAVRFTQAREGTMPAPVYVALSKGATSTRAPRGGTGSSP